MNDCEDFFYNIAGSNETCTGHLSEKLRVPLYVIRGCLCVPLLLYIAKYTMTVFNYEFESNSKKYKQEKLKRIGARSFLLAGICQFMFYVLGNHYEYEYTSVIGNTVAILVMVGTLSCYVGVGSVVLMVLQIYLSSIGDNMRTLIVYDMKPLARFIAPLICFYSVIIILTLAGVIDSGIIFTRVNIASSIPSTVIYAIEVQRYLTPVIKTLDMHVLKFPSELPKAEQLKRKVQFLRDQRRASLSQAAFSAVLFCLLSFTSWLHEPSGIFFLVVQTYLGASVTGFVMLSHRLVIKRDPRPRHSQVSTKRDISSPTSGQRPDRIQCQ